MIQDEDLGDDCRCEAVRSPFHCGCASHDSIIGWWYHGGYDLHLLAKHLHTEKKNNTNTARLLELFCGIMVSIIICSLFPLSVLRACCNHVLHVINPSVIRVHCNSATPNAASHFLWCCT